jgi:hypothetical protein
MLVPSETNEQFCVPAKLYRIGEIVRHTPFTRQTIHNYTTMGLIRESDSPKSRNFSGRKKLRRWQRPKTIETDSKESHGSE